MFRPRRGAYDDRSPYGSFWFEPVGTRTLSGMRVGPDKAMQLAVVFRCVKVLADTFPVLPFGLYSTDSTGKRQLQSKHWLYQLLAVRPNDFQNPFEWRQMCTGHLALRGNVYNEIFANGRGVVTDLIPRHPDRITPKLLPSGALAYIFKQQDGSERVIPRGQMWHLRGLSSDGNVGMSPLGYARTAIGGGLAAQEYGAVYFQNSGAPTGGWIKHPGKFKAKADRDAFVEMWQNARTGENRHKTPVLEDGMEFNELGIKNDDAQFLETRRFTVTDICRFFGVPPHLAYDLDRSTNNNIEQQSIEFATYTMTPIAEMWEASIRYNFLDPESDPVPLTPAFDMRRLMRGDSVTRSSFYKAMFGMGAYSPNRILASEGEDPIEGGGQTFIPVNMTPLKEDMQPPPKPAPGGKLPGEDDSEDEDKGEDGEEQPPKPGKPAPPTPPKPSKNERVSRLAAAAAERLARREVAAVLKAAKQGADAVAEAYEAHARVVADALGVTFDQADRYCSLRLSAFLAAGANVDPEDFEMVSRCRLERLAAEGEV